MAWTHLVFDSKNRCVGFTDEEDDAEKMAAEHNGHYELTETKDPESEPFEGYYGTDKFGNRFHTWDFEESIGELP